MVAKTKSHARKGRLAKATRNFQARRRKSKKRRGKSLWDVIFG